MAKAGKGVRTRQYNPYMSETFDKGSYRVVVWANTEAGPWHVQPYVNNGETWVSERGKYKRREMAVRKAMAWLAAQTQFRSNPGATNLAQYVMAAQEHTRGAHDAGGLVLHETPKSKRREFAKEIWWRRGYRNPFRVTREFIGGPLKGLTHTGVTTVAFKVGQVVKKPIGGSPYKITAVTPVQNPGRPFMGPGGVMYSGKRGKIPYRGFTIKPSGKMFKVFWPDGRQFTQKYLTEEAAYKAVDFYAKNPPVQVERKGTYQGVAQWGITGSSETTPSRATAEKWARLENAARRNPPAYIMPEYRAGKLRTAAGKLVKRGKKGLRTAKAILLSELRRLGRIPERAANPNIVDVIRPGDRVTILTPHGSKLTGKAVMRSSSGGWVLNLGGRHGTPGLADEENIIRVKLAKRNPEGTTADADAAYKMFHGRGPDKTKVRSVALIDPYNEYPNLWQLGKLKSLTVGEFIKGFTGQEGEQPQGENGEAWAVQINFSDSESPDLGGEPGGKQLFIVGGNQNVDRFLAALKVDPSKDPLDCGFVYRIEYFTRKGFDKFQPVNYWHHFGEESGVQPRLIYDRTNHRLQLAGGEYVVKREGIIN